MRRFGQLGVVANMTMNWAGRDAYTVDSVEGYLDPSVMRTIYAARSLQRGGAVLAGGSDWPVTQLLPWRQIEMAITREYDPAEPGVEYEGKLNPSEALSRLDALKMHTQGAAYQLHLNAGAIAKGKLADLIVLDRNADDDPGDRHREHERPDDDARRQGRVGGPGRRDLAGRAGSTLRA